MAEVTNVKEDKKQGVRVFTLKHGSKTEDYQVPLSFSQEATDASVQSQLTVMEQEAGDGADNSPQEAASSDKADYSPDALGKRVDAAEAARAKAQREADQAEHADDDNGQTPQNET